MRFRNIREALSKSIGGKVRTEQKKITKDDSMEKDAIEEHETAMSGL